MSSPTAAILTIGSELTEGLRVDTNSAEIATALGLCGFLVEELASLGDDVQAVADAIQRLTARHALVVTTGGLGPTHDDVTRQAAACALRTHLERDSRLEEILRPLAERHGSAETARQTLSQADIVPGAEVIDAVTGTAPGLMIPTSRGHLVLLPGPPSEMRPMLKTLTARFPSRRAAPRDLGVVGLSESDAQVAAQRALGSRRDIRLTVLARPGDVRVVLFDEGAGSEVLDSAAAAVAAELGEHCYSTQGASLAEAVVNVATQAGVSLALAESCTGGLAAAAITSIPGSSACFRGGVVAYADEVKTALLGVEPETLDAWGAVSEQTARAMASGVLARTGSDLAVSITGVAGPGGGTTSKPVGLVWFGIADSEGSRTVEKRFRPSSRAAVRDQAVATALDLLRREVLFG